MDLRLVLLLESLEFNNSFWHEFILPRKYPTLTEVCSLNDLLFFSMAVVAAHYLYFCCPSVPSYFLL